MIDFVNAYLNTPIGADDVVWSYSGVRPLYDDGASSATAATRDYTLKVDAAGGAPVLHVFGGKITTYRRLAESALEKIGAHFPDLPGHWTAGVPLPGGDFPVDGVADLIARLRADHPFLTEAWAGRLIRAYGRDAWSLLDGAQDKGALGRDFGATLSESEVIWLMEKEWALRAEDVLWRRSKLGLRLDAAQAAALDDYMATRGTASRVAAQ
jgi:glycerol-3-phosphate dehydrogenase